jgi:DNA repair exonuclease SbcCD ATPase subunit
MTTNIATANSSYDREALIEVIEAQQQQLETQQQQINELQEISQQQQQQLDEQAEEIEELQEKIKKEGDRRSAEIEGCHNRISGLEEEIEDADPTPDTPETTIQQSELTPVEQLSRADDPGEVTDSPTVERAISLFKNLDKWGSKTPKGLVLKPADNPLSLLEADRDEQLAWKQYYRAAEALEQLSEGSVTFFDSDRHGKMIVLHEQSDAYDRVVNGTLTPSSVGAEG